MAKRFIALCLLLVLLIGAMSVYAQDSGQPRMHVVQPGENLYRIALN